MLQSIYLYNIKKHRKTKIEFDKGLNVICGTSDEGKSSIILALYWALYNKPNGADYTTFGQKDKGCFVECVFSNGLKVKRLLTKSKNEYHINNEIYKSFRFDVPEELKEQLPIITANLQLQADPYFMLQDSASEVGRMFNEIKGIDEIESTMQKASKNVNEISNKQKYLQEEAEDLKQKEKHYEGIKTLDKKAEGLVEKQNELENKKQFVQKLGHLTDKITEAKLKIGSYDSLIHLYGDVKKSLESVNEFKEHEKEVKALRFYVNKIKNIEKKKGELNYLLEQEKVVDSCLSHINSLADESLNFERVRDTVSLVKARQNDIRKKANLIEKLNEEKVDIEKELKVCPTCDKPF